MIDKAAKSPQRSRSIRRMLAVGMLGLAAAGAAVTAYAEDRGPMGGGHEGGPGAMMFGGPPAHVAHMLDRMLDGLGATDAQRAQIRQIAMSAAADLKVQRDAGRGMHEKAAMIFTAPSVDASAAEALRQQMLTQQDQASKRVLQAMLDISRVLTPEQRARIGQRLQERQAVMQDRMQRMQHEHEHEHDREHGDARPKP